MNPLQTEGKVFTRTRRETVVQYYGTYEPTREEHHLQQVQTETFLQLGKDTLATLYVTWQQCKTLGYSPASIEKKTARAQQARSLLHGGDAEEMGGCGDETASFRRFARLFIERGHTFPPYYDVFARFWMGEDIVSEPSRQARTINILPQPLAADIPSLAWVLGTPLVQNTVVCAAWPIHFQRESPLPAGRLGRIERWSGTAGTVIWVGHPHPVLCIRSMLMIPRSALPSRGEPQRIERGRSLVHLSKEGG